MPTAEQQQTKKPLKPRFKVDPAASPMPEQNSQNASRPGRHQIGMVGEIISESWARSNRYTRARSSESANGTLEGEMYVARSMPPDGLTITAGSSLRIIALDDLEEIEDLLAPPAKYALGIFLKRQQG